MIAFKSLQIKNYKGFADSGEIELAVPDLETNGSGLNIFVGENGTGKTTFLKSIAMFTSGSLRSKLTCADFNCKDDLPEISIIGKTKSTFKYKVPTLRREVDIKEFNLNIKHRDAKSPGKLFSSLFQTSNIVEPTTRQYTTKEGTKTIADFFLRFDEENIIEDGLNIFYFDRSRHLQSRTGYNSTLANALEDLNWKFLNTSDQQEIKKLWSEYYNAVVTNPLGSEISKEFSEKFNSSLLDGVSLELFNLAEPFLSGFFAKASDSNLSQIPLSELGSGVELIFAILFLKRISSGSKGTIIYCIDEPELSLHPQWQKILFELLKVESKTKQIFISTHSPYFLDNSIIKNIKKFSLGSDQINIRSLSDKTSSDEKLLKTLNLENRELFFSKEVILVEGWEDKDRIRAFLTSNNNDIFVMVGLQNLERIKGVCEELDIKFKAIVDLDYLGKYPDLLPGLTSEELESLDEVRSLDEIITLTENEVTIKEAEKLKRKLKDESKVILSSKIKFKSNSDASYKKIIEEKIESEKDQKIFVLPNGVIEDYLNEDGSAKSDQLAKELTKLLEA